MASAWSFLTGRTNQDGDDRPSRRAPGLDAAPLVKDDAHVEARVSRPFDNLGQRNELLRVRFSQMIDRLEDLKSLSDDFSQIAEPLEAIVVELPKAKARVMEVEALLSREIDNGQALRREVDNLTTNLAAMTSDFANGAAFSRKIESDLARRDATTAEQKLLLDDKTALISNIERQLADAVDQRETVAAELSLQRAENEANQHSVQKLELSLQTESDQRRMFEKEAKRLQKNFSEQIGNISALEAKLNDAVQQRDVSKENLSALEMRVSEERALRQNLVNEHDAELMVVSSERTSLGLKVDALTSRLTTTDEILTNIRRQLREKDEVLRTAERSSKDAMIERITVDRRMEGLKADLSHHMSQAQDAQRSRQEFEDRCDMLTKALAAKDASLENAETKVSSLSDRLDGLTKRFENDRMALEAANRRLIEELESERADRTLAQGALEIARENRMTLQRQNETLKRAARVNALRSDPEDDAADKRSDGSPASNVSFLAVADKRND